MGWIWTIVGLPSREGYPNELQKVKHKDAARIPCGLILPCLGKRLAGEAAAEHINSRRFQNELGLGDILESSDAAQVATQKLLSTGILLAPP